jgi:hypothetical protein
MAAAVVIERRTCACWRGEHPDPGRNTDRCAAAHGSTAVPGCRGRIVHREDLWQLYRDELTGADVRVDGWDIRCRWFGVVVGVTPGLCLELIKEAGVSGKRTVGWQADCVIGAVR